MAPPFVSVIIPLLNGSKYIKRCINSIRAQDYPKDYFELIVIDNGSTDNSIEMLKALGVTYYVRTEKGRAHALNLGLQKAKGELICSIDISCVAKFNFITNVVQSFTDEKIGCVAGEIKLSKDVQNKIIHFQDRINYMSPMHAKNRKKLPFLPYADGANASFRMDVFRQIGGFDECFFKAADVEICYRMLILTDYEIAFNPEAIVAEPGEETLYKLLNQRFRIATGRMLLQRKYKDLFKYSEKISMKKAYWRAHDFFKLTVNLIRSNLIRSSNKEQRTIAYDKTLIYFMMLAEITGKCYASVFMSRVLSRVIPIKKEKIDRFLYYRT